MAELSLTIKQEKFCQAYIETGNASEAYRRAYDTNEMKETSVNREAKALIDNPKIAARLQELAQEHLERHKVTVDRVIAEYSKLAFANMQDYIRLSPEGLPYTDFSAMTRDQAAAIQEIKVDRVKLVGGKAKEGEEATSPEIEKVTFKLSDKRGALDSLSKYLGIFVDRAEVTGKDGEPLVPPDSSARDLARAILDVFHEAKREAKVADGAGEE